MDVKTDDDGWVLLDRSGKHFGTVLNFLRDGTVPLPDSRQDLEEILVEARFYCIEGLKNACEAKLEKLTQESQENHNVASIVIVKYPKVAKAIFASTKRPIVKLTMNRYNNVFSYTSNSHDNLLRNIECLEKYALMFADRVLFIKDVRDKCEQNEICEWGFYWRSQKLKSIDCIAIHYSSEKRLIKVEFPESRIHEEMLFLLSISDRQLTDAELLDVAMQRGSGGCTSSSVAATGVPVIALSGSSDQQQQQQRAMGGDEHEPSGEAATTSAATAPRSGDEDGVPTARAPPMFPRLTSSASGSRASFANPYRIGRR
ncbi:BTB/POZ domain-containing adapter for CUL3-mediated RhoA degradation protein 3 [Sparganum proliferum]